LASGVVSAAKTATLVTACATSSGQVIRAAASSRVRAAARARASSGLAAPDLILLDYYLGNHTGADLLYWLRLMKKIGSIPVVMFSGAAGQPHIAEFYANGANYFLSKPKNLERLKIIVRTLHQSLVSLHQPGPIQLLQEYRPDPREHPRMTKRT
jgi:CheY-like chemotaxis protein